MNAAIYARVSHEREGELDIEKSVTRQEENARAFAAQHGWTVKADHVYKDDGIGGAEFARRPGYQQMMQAALVPKPPFSILIVSEQKSLGRETFETNFTIKQLSVAGIEIYEYMRGKSLTPKNYMDKMVSTIQAGADEAHREQTSERVHEAFIRKAKAGLVVGGRVFGYTNQRISQSQVERVIDPIEKEVVIRIFQLYDEGMGLKRISKILTQEGAAFPKPFIRKDPTKWPPVCGWSPSTVGAVLQRDLYRGVLIWNKSRKSRAAWGGVKQTPRPESEWIRTADEKLRIIDDDLWGRVESRRKDVAGKAIQFSSGRMCGGPSKRPTQNLLAGLAKCGCCGGGMIVETSPRKRGRVPEYVCARRRYQSSCTNALRMNVADVNEAVLQAVEAHALTPESVEAVIHLSERDDTTELQDKLIRESKDIEKRIQRLVAAIETGVDAASVATKLRELEKRRAEIAVEATALHPIPRLAPEVIESRLSEWRRLLRGSTTQARTVLQRILSGLLTLTPRQNPLTGEPDGYDFAGPTRFDRLFTGIAVAMPAHIRASTTRRGFHDTTPDDTFDGDYGRILDQAAQKLRGCKPTPSGTPQR